MRSLIIPFYNEKQALAKNIPGIISVLDSLKEDYELILYDDSSNDGSDLISQNFVSNKTKIIRSKTRLGRGASLSDAIKKSNGDIVAYMDADCSTSLEHLSLLFGSIADGSDIATGSRLLKDSKVIGRSFLRETSSRGYNLMLRLLFRTKLSDHQCGFKSFKRSSVLPLLDKVKSQHWFWDSELLILAQAIELKVVEFPVIWTDDTDSTVDLKKDIFTMGLEAISLRFRLWFSN